MHCSACGVETIDGAAYCHKCGQRVVADTGNVPAAPAGTFDAAARPQSPDQPETELWRGGYSSAAMRGAWLICLLISLALLVAGFFLAQTTMHWLIVFAVMLLPWLYYAAAWGYRAMSVHYLLTTQRFIHEHGILRRVNGRIELLDIDDISFEQGLMERMFGVGTIRIVSHDRSDPDLVLLGIANVKEVAGVMDNARLAERRRRGLHVEQI